MFNFFKSGYRKVQEALLKTRSALGKRLTALLRKPWDDSTREELEKILYEADLGTSCTEDFLRHLEKEFRSKPGSDLETISKSLQAYALNVLQSSSSVSGTMPKEGEPLVLLIIGVNGSGKTTSIAKLGKYFRDQGKTVLFGAGDTFRAAAGDQLSTWAERIGADIVRSLPGSDPSGVIFDTLTAGKTRGTDVILLDTAGRLQNKTELMLELEKVKKTCGKVLPGAPHETLLVLDATTGQNALDQAKVFHSKLPLTGLILTKLDGSAKGGIVLSIYKELKIPIRWIGTGESAEDLLPFDPVAYTQALFTQD